MLSALLALAGKGNKRRDSFRSTGYMVGGGLMGDDESVWEASVLVLNVATYRCVVPSEGSDVCALIPTWSILACFRCSSRMGRSCNIWY